MQAMPMTEQAEEINALFQQYLEICNKAIETHKESFPYKHIWEAAEQLQRRDGMHLTVYDDEPKYDYRLKIQDKHLEVVQESPEHETDGWRVNTSYLKRVVENPDEYIRQPSKLDWHWLKNRVDLD